MNSSDKLSGTFITFTTQRVISDGRPSDEFDVRVTIKTSKDTLVGSARVSRHEDDRIYQYFLDIQRVTIEIDGPVMFFVLDQNVAPMPAFRLIPSPALAH